MLETQMALRSQSNCPQLGCSSLGVVGDGDSVQIFGKQSCLGVANVSTQWRCGRRSSSGTRRSSMARRNTAKHTEAKQNGTNSETKRIEAEKVAEMQESIRPQKETLRVAHEEIKKPRADLVQEGESMDKNRSHVLSCLEEVRNLELLEKGNRFETNGCSDERRNDGGDRQLVYGSGTNRVGDFRKEENPRGGGERIHRGRHHDVRR